MKATRSNPVQAVNLTAEQWTEIYYALELKAHTVRKDADAHPDGNQDNVDLEAWHAQLLGIMQVIGPDGRRAADFGAPNAGCVWIEYLIDGEWRRL